VTIGVAGAAPADRTQGLDAEALDAEIRARLAAGESSRTIAAGLTQRSGLRRRDVYARAVALRERG
jgi:16S rRNA (cytidine1402-2'-O)-methyltransferase